MLTSLDLDDNSGNISLSDTYANFHDYEIQWTPDTITWLVDGQVGRVKKRSDTWNATSNQWAFPQTPARVQISIWPAGASSNAEGTIQWAGGPIDWSSSDIVNYGYDFATFGQISVECYNATSPPGTNTGKSYTFNSAVATNDTVTDGNDSTILKSFLGSGNDMNAGASSATSGTAGPSSTGTPANSIPGGGNGAVGQNPGSAPDNSDGGSSAGSGSGSGSSGTAAAPTCVATGFSQNNCGNGSPSSKSDGVRGVERTLGASALAVIVGFAGLLFL